MRKFIVVRLIYLCNLATYIERVDYSCLKIKIKNKKFEYDEAKTKFY